MAIFFNFRLRKHEIFEASIQTDDRMNDSSSSIDETNTPHIITDWRNEHASDRGRHASADCRDRSADCARSFPLRRTNLGLRATTAEHNSHFSTLPEHLSTASTQCFSSCSVYWSSSDFVVRRLAGPDGSAHYAKEFRQQHSQKLDSFVLAIARPYRT